MFDALTSKRAYKKAWTQADEEALIISESGKHLEPSLVDTFVLSLSEIKTIKSLYIDNNEEGKHEKQCFYNQANQCVVNIDYVLFVRQ